jgi:hypothetical protein
MFRSPIQAHVSPFSLVWTSFHPSLVPGLGAERRRQLSRHPDVAMSSAGDGGVDIYLSFSNPGYFGFPNPPGWYLAFGTSEASPLFAGIVAIADQAAHHDLGLLNPALYRLQGGAGIVDVTVGNNTFGGVTRYNAAPGYDMASGQGTIDATQLVRELAR